MKKRLLIFLIAAFISGCAAEKVQKGPIIVTGNITHFNKDEVKFSHREYTLFSSQISKKVPVNADGSFKMELPTDVPTKGFFALGSVPASYKIHVTTPTGKDSTFNRDTNNFRLVYLYLQPGDSVHMQVDVDDIPKSLSFSGENAQNSIFVNKEENEFNSYGDKVRNNSYNISTWEPEKYESIINKQKKEKLQFLEDYSSSNNISDHLKSVYKWKYYADAVTSKIYYKSTRERFLHKKVELPENYYRFMDNVPLAEDFSDKGIGYFYFLDSYLKKKYALKTGKEADGEGYYQYVKQQVDGKPAYEYLVFALGRDFNRTLYDEFDDDCPYPQLAQQVKKNYKHLEGMLAGSPAPKVTLTSTSGKSVPLSNFKGHYVYLDFWATWCKPCIEEIPHLQKLKKEYKNKNIKFISISVDDEAAIDKWKKFIHDRNLSGGQYWVDDKNNKVFSKAFNIRMIPRFVLIDDKGKIVDANAPRPSQKNVRTLLDKNI